MYGNCVLEKNRKRKKFFSNIPCAAHNNAVVPRTCAHTRPRRKINFIKFICDGICRNSRILFFFSSLVLAFMSSSPPLPSPSLPMNICEWHYVSSFVAATPALQMAHTSYRTPQILIGIRLVCFKFHQLNGARNAPFGSISSCTNIRMLSQSRCGPFIPHIDSNQV